MEFKFFTIWQETFNKIYAYKYFVEAIIYYIPKDLDDVRHFFPKVLRRIKSNVLKIPRRYIDKKKCPEEYKKNCGNKKNS